DTASTPCSKDLAEFLTHSASTRRRRYSTAARVVVDTNPQCWASRPFAMEGTASHLMKLRVVTTATGRVPSTSGGLPLARAVTGMTITDSAGHALKRFADTTRHGLRPPCSWPQAGSRSANQLPPALDWAW